MTSGWTNKGKFQVLGIVVRNAAEPTNFFVFLATSAATPGADTNTKSEMTEIAAGNGYTANGTSLNRDATDFDVLTEDDTGDIAFFQIKDIVWTASGGPIPSSGGGARWFLGTDDNVTPASREIYWYWDLVSDRSVSDGQTLTIQNAEARLTE